MAIHRSAIGIAQRRTAVGSRFFSSGGRGSPECSTTTSALRRPALSSSIFCNGVRGSLGCSDTTRRRMCSFGRGGSKWNDDCKSSNAFGYEEFTRMNILFCGIASAVMVTLQLLLRALQDRKWQCMCERLDNTEKGTWMMAMMEDQKAEEVNSSSR